MPKLNQKGLIAQFLVLLVLAAGLIGGLYLVQHPQIFKPKAAPALPQNPEASFELELENTATAPFPDETIPPNLTTGANFRVDIYARADTDAANLFSAKLLYSAGDTLEFVEINKREGQSFATSWVEASADPNIGMVSLTGAVPNPGIKTDPKQGAYLLGSVIFKAKKAGTAKIELSDSSAIYSNTNNINILTARKGAISVPIQDTQPTPTPAPKVSCEAIEVKGVIASKSGQDTIYIVDSGGSVNLKAYVIPENSKVAWTGYNSSNLPDGGKWDPADQSVTVWTAPKNSTQQLEGVQVRADIAGSSPTISCKAVNMAVKPAYQFVPPPVSEPVAQAVQQVKTWMLIYRPQGSFFNVLNDDPANFTKNTLLPAMNEASKQALNYTLADADIHTENSPPPQAGGRYDYRQLFTKYDLCSLAKQNNIKAVILWADGTGPYGGGMWESAITGNKGIPTNGAQLSFCPDKTIVVYGLNYTRGLTEALESYGHHLERVFGQYRPEYSTWADRDSCGNDHNPPNSRFEYDRSNTASFQSDCRNWKPDGSGTKESLSCTTWGCDGAQWLKFWMQNMPGMGNTLVSSSGQKIPNWWVYIGDPDNCYNNPFGCLAQASPAPSSPPSPVSGTGDGNNDGKTNLVDLSVLLSDINKTTGFRGGVDLNGDGKVNTFDFSLMRNLLIEKKVIRG